MGKGKGSGDELPGGPGGGNINQIRDILIGPFQREQEARFERAERSLARLAEETTAATTRAQEKLQKSLDAAMDGLESKIADLSKRFNDMADAQKRDSEALAAELSGRIKELGRSSAAISAISSSSPTIDSAGCAGTSTTRSESSATRRRAATTSATTSRRSGCA